MTNTKFKALKNRRKSREIMVGNIGIGGNNPVRVQTMTNTDTLNVKATVKQIIECVQAGSELIRIATQTPKHVRKIKEIREELKNKKINIPIIADIHYLPSAAFEALKYADKIRLNPGNFLSKNVFQGIDFNEKNYAKQIAIMEKSLLPFIKELKKTKIPIRIGSNLGSLSERIVKMHGNTPDGMVVSTMEYLRIFKKHNFNEIVVALKASDPLIMIEANRMLVYEMKKEKMDYPIHLGVTEAGNANEGRAKSIIGIGTLILEGIGDTIRVSLTEHPAKEIPVCYDILQATRRRITKTEFISCPGCGRTQFDIEKVANKVKKKTEHLKGLRIAVMGCIVNGLGEMGDADFGYIGGIKGKVNLYFKKKLMKKNVLEKNAVEELIDLIKQKGKWQ